MNRLLSTLILALLMALGCSSSIAGTSTPAEEDAAVLTDVQIDVFTQDGGTPDAPRDTTPERDVLSDTGRRWPIRAAVSSVAPAARSIPRNATGIYTAAFDLTDEGMSVPIRTIYFRRVGVGSAADTANVYYFALTNASRFNTIFRYSTGHAVNPTTNVIAMPFEGRNIRPGETATILLYMDLAPGMVGAQHAIELTGILVEDGTRDGLLVPIEGVRSNALTISPDLASRLDVQRGSPTAPVHAGIPSQTIGTFRLRAGYHDLDVVYFSFEQGGSIEEWHELSELELWRRQGTSWVRIPINEWTYPLNGHLVLAPTLPVLLTANTITDFEIRGRATTSSRRTIRLFAVYPADVQANDRTLMTPAATCISPIMTSGCDGPGQGSFDGTGENLSETIVEP